MLLILEANPLIFLGMLMWALHVEYRQIQKFYDHMFLFNDSIIHTSTFADKINNSLEVKFFKDYFFI